MGRENREGGQQENPMTKSELRELVDLIRANPEKIPPQWQDGIIEFATALARNGFSLDQLISALDIIAMLKGKKNYSPIQLYQALKTLAEQANSPASSSESGRSDVRSLQDHVTRDIAQLLETTQTPQEINTFLRAVAVADRVI